MQQNAKKATNQIGGRIPFPSNPGNLEYSNYNYNCSNYNYN